MADQRFLRRYTTLASAIDLLAESRLTLLSPATWDDSNDRHYLERYREARGAGSVLALCFARAPETYHHWKVFTTGTEGVCVEFDEAKLLSQLPPVVRSGDVTYVQIRDIAREVTTQDKWPFLKRYPFRDEAEFRLIYEDRDPDLRFKYFPVTQTAVRRVTTSPWLPESLHETLKATIKGMPGCKGLEVRRTTLISSDQWKKALPTGGMGGP